MRTFSTASILHKTLHRKKRVFLRKERAGQQTDGQTKLVTIMRQFYIHYMIKMRKNCFHFTRIAGSLGFMYYHIDIYRVTKGSHI
jgi:hypothetical protein